MTLFFKLMKMAGLISFALCIYYIGKDFSTTQRLLGLIAFLVWHGTYTLAKRLDAGFEPTAKCEDKPQRDYPYY